MKSILVLRYKQQRFSAQHRSHRIRTPVGHTSCAKNLHRELAKVYFLVACNRLVHFTVTLAFSIWWRERSDVQRSKLHAITCILVVGICLTSLGCSSPLADYICVDDGDCNGSNVTGRCEPEGHCSFADEDCDSGFRFGEESGAETNSCTLGLLVDASSAAKPIDAGVVLEVPDATRALTITDIVAYDITETAVTITWTVSENATGLTEFGTTTSYGTLSTLEDSFTYSTHIQRIKDLMPNTLYHFRVHSRTMSDEEIVSLDNTFTTIDLQ